MPRKKRRNSKPTIFDWCIICGKHWAELHEVFFGPNSQNSKEYGMQCRLCAEHHRGVYGVHGKHGHEMDIELKKHFQKKFEERYSHEKFMEVFGRNYLDEQS